MTHHHIHHIVSSKNKEAGTDLSDPELKNLLIKSLYKLNNGKSGIDSIFADGSSQTAIKLVPKTLLTSSEQANTKHLEVESEQNDPNESKNINHEIVFEDDEDDQRGLVHVYKQGNTDRRTDTGGIGATKQIYIEKIGPAEGVTDHKYITMAQDMAKSELNGKSGKNPV